MIRKTEQDETFVPSNVDEIRAIRAAIDEEVGHDVKRLAEKARAVGEAICQEFGMRRVEIEPKTKTGRRGKTIGD